MSFGVPLIVAISLLWSRVIQAPAPSVSVPPVRREFRAAWVATVDNIDWPSKPGLPVETQKAELLAILDRAAQLRLNAVILQVRPACDALYASTLEPWSEYLTGRMGQPPEPYYDPLAFAIEEAHRRGLELHAWFNPYRARHPSGKSPIADQHISRTRPDLVRTYGRFLWLDPGEPDVQAHSLAVILDVVRRYDVDGVHIDDYFYPYKERDAQGRVLDFPDEPRWQQYRTSGGRLSRDDWRRQNVDAFVERMYRVVKAEKPWVKVGISPFGIYRPGYPEQIKGFDQYTELYADVRKWLVNGWMDYLAPQLYWPIEQREQSFAVLLHWWVSQNSRGRHLWPGSYTSRVGEAPGQGWPPEEIVYQIKVTRGQAGATGNVHFSMKALMQNRRGLADLLASGVYAEPALVPASPWLGKEDLPAPGVVVQPEGTGEQRFQWRLPEGHRVRWWLVRMKRGDRWEIRILPGQTTELRLEEDVARGRVQVVAVTGVDRYGNEGQTGIWQDAAGRP
ncbi:MAG: family 10 glycosylhydrolase [Chloroherpetonaceae bacterium]|nr:family 10 glycosylhydrolase [Chthonomonadaceae bacterium]MDW8207768.1 family 10 glycosylhydrolase [Chloroherpetonaceae bacterium]